MDESYFRALAGLIQDAARNGVLFQAKGLTGFSGDSIVGTLQRLVQFQENESCCCYLEVGVYQGMTLVSSAISSPHFPVFGIDNFAQFDSAGENAEIVKERVNENSASNVQLVNADYEDALGALDGYIGANKVAVYFIDGPHDYRSQRMCLDLVLPFLTNNAVIVVDDSNYRHVRQANSDFLFVNPEYKLLYQAYTPCHPNNAKVGDLGDMRKGWWNGVNIIVRDPANVLAPEYPPTLRSRILYENEHIVHANRHGYASPQAIKMASAMMSLKPWEVLRSLVGLFRIRRKTPDDLVGSYPTLNTFSSELSSGSFNATVRSGASSHGA